jgi:hypothetical protein
MIFNEVNNSMEYPEKKAVKLNNVRQMRKFISRVMNEVYTNQISTDQARTLSTLANTYSKLYELSETEKRLDIIEKQLSINNESLFLPEETDEVQNES